MRHRYLLSFALLAPLIVLLGRSGAGQAPPPGIAAAARQPMQIFAADGQHQFRLSSTTFENDTQVPQTIVLNGTLGNVCTGNNESPELSWTPGVRGTRSYVVIVFDVTANFTHWGIYNIAPSVTRLPLNAGIAGSKYGDEITNDAGVAGYSGPCPPPGLVHHYVFTVYALDTDLHLQSSSQFPANAETLLRAMIGHVLETASITGLYST